eukprot:Colp12_sorted_trinity150504_noHs@9837
MHNATVIMATPEEPPSKDTLSGNYGDVIEGGSNVCTDESEVFESPNASVGVLELSNSALKLTTKVDHLNDDFSTPRSVDRGLALNEPEDLSSTAFEETWDDEH